MMIHYSQLSQLSKALRSLMPIRQIISPYECTAELSSQRSVRERRCTPGASICTGDAASKVVQEGERPISNPNEWIAKLSQVLVQERKCPTGESLCHGEIASKIMQGIDLSLFREPQLETMVAAFDKYSAPSGSLGDKARHRLLSYYDRMRLQQYSVNSQDSMSMEDKSMKYGMLNSNRAALLSSPFVQCQRSLSATTALEALPTSSSYLRPTTSSLISPSNRFTPPSHYSGAPAVAPLPTGPAFESSMGFSYRPLNHTALWGAWPTSGRFRGAPVCSAATSTSKAERVRPETPNWVRQAAQLVARMSCQSITSEQVITAIDGCLTGIKARYTPVAETIIQPDPSRLSC